MALYVSKITENGDYETEMSVVYHHNLIGHEINESLLYYADHLFDREIYCHKAHTIKEPMKTDCENCSYFAGFAQGHGIICAWEDVEAEEYVIKHEDRYKEFERVDKFMKLKVIDDVRPNLISKVKHKDYDKDKWVYIQSEDSLNRFLLGTKGEKTLLCCGVNPSFASPEDLDPTMRNVEAHAKQLGYDSYIMINLYPMRATNPKDMHKEMDEAIVKKNLEVIESVLKNGKCDIWAAWGTLIMTRKYLKECLGGIVELADKYDCKWFTIGNRSKEGHPHHPLYLSRKSEKENFDVHEYIKSL